jgi:hypothetical protein
MSLSSVFHHLIQLPHLLPRALEQRLLIPPSPTPRGGCTLPLRALCDNARHLQPSHHFCRISIDGIDCFATITYIPESTSGLRRGAQFASLPQFCTFNSWAARTTMAARTVQSWFKVRPIPVVDSPIATYSNSVLSDHKQSCLSHVSRISLSAQYSTPFSLLQRWLVPTLRHKAMKRPSQAHLSPSPARPQNPQYTSSCTGLQTSGTQCDS